MNDSISILEQLVTAIEQAGVNVAPTYQEYMPLAFAIANSCGEEGRTRFHRICRISEKYHHDEADKLYGHALTKGTGRNSLGTVFHLAEVAGVKMDPKLANLQNLQSLHTHTRARVSYNAHPDASDGTPPDAVFTDPASPLSDGVSKTILPARLPSFPDYRWPAFLQGIIDCGNSPAQRDILLLGAATVLGSTLNKLVSFVYGRKHKYPCLQVFVTAPPATGKGTPFGRTHTQRAAGHLPGKNKDLPHGKDQMGHFGEGKGKYPRTRTAPAENAPHSRRQYRYRHTGKPDGLRRRRTDMRNRGRHREHRHWRRPRTLERPPPEMVRP